MYLLFQKILLFHTNILIPNTDPYDWFKLSYDCFRVAFLPLYLLFGPFWGLFTYSGVSKTWPHKKDVHHFWSLHPPWRYAPSVGLKHDTNGNFLALGLTWIPKMGGWLLYYWSYWSEVSKVFCIIEGIEGIGRHLVCTGENMQDKRLYIKYCIELKGLTLAHT